MQIIGSSRELLAAPPLLLISATSEQLLEASPLSLISANLWQLTVAYLWQSCIKLKHGTTATVEWNASMRWCYGCMSLEYDFLCLGNRWPTMCLEQFLNLRYHHVSTLLLGCHERQLRLLL
jgi:hypothetical protein